MIKSLLEALNNNVFFKCYYMSIHSKFLTNGAKRDLLSIKFGMLRTCKTKTTHVGETSS